MPDGTTERYPVPRALATHEIPDIVEHYRQAAVNAIRAGQQFLHMITSLILFSSYSNYTVMSFIGRF